MLKFISTHIPWNTISNLELWQLGDALCSQLILPSASTLRNICQREYSLTVEEIKKQLPSSTKVSVALGVWTSMNSLRIMSVIECNNDRNWVLWEVNMIFSKVERLFFSYLESYFRIIGPGSTYWSKPSGPFEGSSWLFWAYGQLFTENYIWYCFHQLLNAWGTTNNSWGLWNWVACIEKPHTMYGAHHPACFRCIQLALDALMSNLGAREHTMSCEVHEYDQQFGENECSEIGHYQRLQKEGNARINMVSAMRPGSAMTNERVCISRYFESHQTDLHIAPNARWIDNTNTGSSKRVHWLSTSQCPNRCAAIYGSEDRVEFNTGLARTSLPIIRIRPRVAQESTILLVPPPFPNSGQLDRHEVCHGWIKASPIVDPVDVELVYHCSTLRDHCVQ